MEPLTRPPTLLLRRLHLIASCCVTILWLVGLGAILSRMVMISPLLPSYPGWSFSWMDATTIAIGFGCIALTRGGRISKLLAACILHERQRTRLIIAVAPIVIALAIVIGKLTIGRTESYRNMLDEGGFIEYLTAITLFAGALLSSVVGWRFWRRKERLLAVVNFLYSAFLFVFWGEEVSWGQRTIGWVVSETLSWQLPSFFVNYNVQNEFNFHNLVWIVPYMKTASALVGVFVLLVAVLFFLILRTGSPAKKLAVLRVMRYSVPGWYLMPLFFFAALLLGVVSYCEYHCPHTRYFGVIIPADSEIGECLLAVGFLLFVLANYFRQASLKPLTP